MFTKKVDLRSRKSMVDYLEGHFRYDTMSSWNRLTSYANNVKLYNLGLTSDQLDKAFEMLDMDEYWYEVFDGPIESFTERNHNDYTIGSNGRSSGYLVMYNSYLKALDYKSYCTLCGQRNYKLVPSTSEEAADSTRYSTDEKCGVCRSNSRVNYKEIPKILNARSQGIDQDESFSGWSIEELRSRVKLVQDFDETCKEIRQNLIEFLANNDVGEEAILVTETVKVLKPAA